MRCSPVRKTAHAHAHQRVDVSYRKLLHFFVELLDKSGPVFQANLKDLSVINLTYANEVEVCMCEVVSIRQFLDKLLKASVSVSLHSEPSHISKAFQSITLTSRWALKKLERKSARLSTNSWSLELLFAKICFKSIDKGIVFETMVSVSVNMNTSRSS